MASRTIEIILRAKNAMATGLQAAGNALKTFGSAAISIGKAAGTALIGAGTAIFTMAKKAISAWAESEQAYNGLSSALRANGESADAAIPALRNVAQAIMDETGASDESTVSMMGRLRMLGVHTDKLGEAAKATMALSSVGLEGEAAQRAVALAMQGNYSLLKRYVPALRTATTEEEKAAIVKELFAKGYEQQKAQLQTLTGQWGLMKTRLGEAMEEMGRAMSGNVTVMRELELANEKIKAIGEAIGKWIDESGVEIAVARFKALFAWMSFGWKDQSPA